MSNKVSEHYDHKYYEWQDSIGEFGGWANQTKFAGFITITDNVMDFGSIG